MKKYIKSSSKYDNTIVDDLWSWVCSNNIDKVVEYFENGGKVGLKYPRFGTNHSLIMGAVRNGNYELANILADYGEDVSHREAAELLDLYNKFSDESLDALVEKLVYTN